MAKYKPSYREGGGFPCPVCDTKTRVLDSRLYKYEDCSRRRRVCMNPECLLRFTTHEMVRIRADIVVTKRNGVKEPFDIKKLVKSMELATWERNITPERIHRIAQVIGETLDFGTRLDRKPSKGEYRLTNSAYIGHLVMESLKALDSVALVRYASIHKRFNTMEDFQNLLDSLD